MQSFLEFQLYCNCCYYLQVTYSHKCILPKRVLCNLPVTRLFSKMVDLTRILLTKDTSFSPSTITLTKFNRAIQHNKILQIWRKTTYIFT